MTNVTQINSIKIKNEKTFKNNIYIFSKLVENCKFTDTKSSTIPNTDKSKKKKKTPIPKHVTIKSLKTSDKEKNHKSSHRKKIYANEQSLGL